MKIHVKVPATTANLGPGYDALGLALNLWNEAEFVRTDDKRICVNVSGEGAERLPRNAKNAISQAALQIYAQARQPCPGLRINCLNRIPLGSGLGSSSAAVLTGMLGANALLGNPFTPEEILQLAAQSEGHPDNIAPALLGGLVVSLVHEKRVHAMKLPLQKEHPGIQITIVLPAFRLSTQAARKLLPEQVAHADAVFNISRVVLVIEALRSSDLELLGIAMKDRLHQPYRLPVIPGASAALEAGKKAGAAAVALSGAGPSLIAFASIRDAGIGSAMKRAFESAGLSARVFEVATSDEGAIVSQG
ncbi:MAG: homoserine kinase [Anaerolineales bacterium]